MIIPIAREYPLVIHCPIDVLIPKYSTTLGRAVVIAVDKIDDAIPDTTRQRKIIVLLPLLNCISFLFSMMFLHSVPYFLIDIVCHPLQGMFCQRQFLPGDIPAQRLIEVCVDCLVSQLPEWLSLSGTDASPSGSFSSPATRIYPTSPSFFIVFVSVARSTRNRSAIS